MSDSLRRCAQGRYLLPGKGAPFSRRCQGEPERAKSLTVELEHLATLGMKHAFHLMEFPFPNANQSLCLIGGRFQYLQFGRHRGEIGKRQSGGKRVRVCLKQRPVDNRQILFLYVPGR